MTEQSLKPKPFDGGARWIWSAEGVHLPRPDTGPFRVRYFRRTFDAGAGARLVVHVSADSRYKLWCNGVLVSRGPAKGDVAHQFYETVDVGEHLRPGRNVLAAQVEYYGDVWCKYGQGGGSVSRMTACPGFVLDGVLVGPDPKAGEALGTNRQWRVLIDGAHHHQIDPGTSSCVGMLEDLDCGKYPWGFTRVEFDDSPWRGASEICAAVCLDSDHDSFVPQRLVPRMIAPLTESAPRPFATAFRSPTGEDLAAWSGMLAGGGQVEIAPGRQAVVLIDAGELTTGYPQFGFSNGAGAEISIRYAEALTDEDGRKTRRGDLTFGDVHGHRDIVRPDGPPRTYEPFFWRTFRFVRVEITTADQPLMIHSLEHVFSAYPFEELARAETSDPDGKGIWEISWWTARLCAHETYEDCPYYEQLQYGGDTQVQAMISYVVAGDASLARQFLYQFDWSRRPDGLTRSRYPSRVPQTIPYWSLHWVMSVRDYWRHTADREALRDLLPGVRATMDYFLRRLTDEGIVGKLDGWRVADWCPQWKDDVQGSGVPPGASQGRAAFDSVMTIAALRDAADLAEAAGEDASDLRAAAESLKAAAHKTFYDPARGLYRDTPDRQIASAYTNVWAILAGMPCDLPALAEIIVRDKSLCELTMFSRYFAWRALAAAGRYDLAPEMLDLWRKMLQWDLTTCPEVPDFARNRSDCHAWSAAPLVEYCREILGVRPAEPGYAVIGIEPKPAGLARARGRVPLARLTSDQPPRFVHVDWHIDGDQFVFKAEAPEGIPCRVRLPGGQAQEFPNGGKIRMDSPL